MKFKLYVRKMQFVYRVGRTSLNFKQHWAPEKMDYLALIQLDAPAGWTKSIGSMHNLHGDYLK